MPFIMELSLTGSVFRRPAPAVQWILQSFPAGKPSSMQPVVPNCWDEGMSDGSKMVILDLKMVG